MKIRLFDSFSLKDKRKVRLSIIKNVENKFKISVAEVLDQEIYNSLGLAFAMVSSDKKVLDKTYMAVIDMIENGYQAEVYESYFEEY